MTLANECGLHKLSKERAFARLEGSVHMFVGYAPEDVTEKQGAPHSRRLAVGHPALPAERVLHGQLLLQLHHLPLQPPAQF